MFRKRSDNGLMLRLNYFEKHVLGYALFCLGKFEYEQNDAPGYENDEYVNEHIPILALSPDEYAALTKIKNLLIYGNEAGKEGR
jgi:hypothetical protein